MMQGQYDFLCIINKKWGQGKRCVILSEKKQTSFFLMHKIFHSSLKIKGNKWTNNVWLCSFSTNLSFFFIWTRYHSHHPQHNHLLSLVSWTQNNNLVLKNCPKWDSTRRATSADLIKAHFYQIQGVEGIPCLYLMQVETIDQPMIQDCQDLLQQLSHVDGQFTPLPAHVYLWGHRR